MKRKRKNPLDENDVIATEANVNFNERRIYLGDIDFDTALEFQKNLTLLEADSKKAITLHIMSSGGSVEAGWAIYDLIKMSKCPIDVVAWGRCNSMATVIMQACRKRFLSPTCNFMIHEGSIEQEGETEHRNTLSFNRSIEIDVKYFYKIYAERTGLGVDDLYEIMRSDCYLTAQEAIDLGFADEMLQPPKKELSKKKLNKDRVKEILKSIKQLNMRIKP